MRSLLPQVAPDDAETAVALEPASSDSPATQAAPTPYEDVVQLRCAPLPYVLRHVALHHWFTRSVPTPAVWERWEVWQSQNRGGTSWGHVHRDLMAPQSGVGGGPGWVAAEWRGDEARRIAAVLDRSAEEYPYPGRYLAWPGPNSNTFVAWVLREAGVADDLDPRGIGKDFLGAWGIGASLRRTDLRLETPLLGVRARRGHGLELHLLGLTLGIAARPFTLHTPFGTVTPGRQRPTGRRRIMPSRELSSE